MTNDGVRWEVPDRGGRTLVVHGQELATASAQRPGKRRWLELKLYKSNDGTYVLAGAGHSTVPGETTRCWARQCGTAAGVLEQLYLYDEDETRYLTDVAIQLLQDAGRCDEDIKQAYELEHVA